MISKKLSCTSFNCKGFKVRNYAYVNKLFSQTDILFLQEHWLHSFEFNNFSRILPGSQFVAKSSMCDDNIIVGRPFGGVAIIWKHDCPFKIERIDTCSPRLVAVRAYNDYVNVLFINTYMPCNINDKTEEFINILTEIMTICNMYESSDVVLGGDFNCDLCLQDARADIFKEFSDLSQLNILTNNQIYNIQYTFSNSLNNKSLIDHFLINSRLMPAVSNLEVISEGDNLSDHLPLKLNLSLYCNLPETKLNNYVPNSKIKFDWSDCLLQDKNNYKIILKNLLDCIDIPVDSVLCHSLHCKIHYEQFIKYQYCIIEAIELASFGSIPHYKSHLSKLKVVKGWNENVESFRRNSLFWHEIWKQCERPNTGIVSDIRKHTRSLYHKAIKNNNDLQNDIIKFNVASNLISCNSQLFWREINKITSAGNNFNVQIEGKSGQEECDVFRCKYKELYNKPSNYDDLDNECCNIIQNTCVNSINVPDKHLHTVTPFMVKNAVKYLNKGKKEESSSLYSDSVKEAPDELFVHLANLFTIMLRHSYSSHIFNLVTFSPLIKDKRKDHGSIENYRAIALNSCLGKLLDYIFLDFFKVSFSTSSHQFAYKQEFSTTLCTYMVIETIQYYQSRDTNVIASCLDFSKAFDLVKYDKLFKILLERKICPLVIKLLINFYSNIRGEVKWENCKSDIFDIKNGVKQGGVLSPVLFTMYIDCLIDRVEKKGIGCHVGNRNVSIFVYADDIILLSPTFGAMKALLNTCESFGQEFGLRFNISKSEVILFGKFHNVPDLALNNKNIQIKNKIKYLGNFLINNDRIIDYKTNVSDIKVRCNAILSNFRFLTFEAKREIFRCQTGSYYGCELLNLHDKTIRELDVAWRVSSRRLLGVDMRTHCYLLPFLMNCHHPSDEIALRILKFYYKGINSSDNLINFIFRNSFYSMSSFMCQNIFLIMNKLSMPVLALFQNDFKITSAIKKLKFICEMDWKSSLIVELLKCRDGAIFSNLNSYEIDLILKNLCTS